DERPRPVPVLVAELDSADGRLRVEATKELFRRGPAVLKELESAGAKPVTPADGKAGARRPGVGYSLLEGVPADTRRDRIPLRFDIYTTEEMVDRMGEAYGFRFAALEERHPLAGAVPVSDMGLAEGKKPEDVLRAVLGSEARVVTAGLRR